jgi:apolipoprotein N-acyltransferase
MRADGTLLDLSPLDSEWTRLYEIPYRKESHPTFYQEYGFRLVPALLWLTAVILLATGRRGRQGGS